MIDEITNNLWIGPDYDTKLTFNIQCPHCGTVVNNYMKYCYECGKKLIVEVKTVKEDFKNE